MCGILLTNALIKDLESVIRVLKKRGPDCTNHVKSHGFNLIHTLLSMTGKGLTKQPLVYENGTIMVLFNGEIYNYKSFGDLQSDGEAIYLSYKKYGDNFVKNLYGEFALTLIDMNKNLLYFSTDIFSTKPLWYCFENKQIGICSYASCLRKLNLKNIKQVEANQTYKVNLSDLKIIKKSTVYDFDLRQHKNNYNDVIKAFENAIKMRTSDVKHKIFMGLSSGYDSGAISCALNHLNISYTAYSIIGNENVNIINQRHNLIKNAKKIQLSRPAFLNAQKYLKENCEEYLLRIDNGDKESYIFNQMKLEEEKRKPKPNKNTVDTLTINGRNILKLLKYRLSGQYLTDDNGSIGVSHICSLAKQNNELIYLSGSGADEILSDYGFNGVKHYAHSTIGGKFPPDLKTVFPWKNFFSNTQRAYLMKEEYVTGAYGIEGRYPFLDKNFVQEFLWLIPELKNKYYKAPIYHYLKMKNYPFDLNNKKGFGCGFNSSKENFSCNDKQYKPNYVGSSSNPELIVDDHRNKAIELYNRQKPVNFDSLLKSI